MSCSESDVVERATRARTQTPMKPPPASDEERGYSDFRLASWPRKIVDHRARWPRIRPSPNEA